MTAAVLSALIFGGSLVAGFLGSLTGLGGGVVIVPLLALAFGVDIRYAIGASLVSVIATSSGAAAAYVREGFSNIRIGMFLEMATTVGALAGAALAAHVSTSAIAIVFGIVLMYSAISGSAQHVVQADVVQPDMVQPDRLQPDAVQPEPVQDGEARAATRSSSLAERLRLSGTYPSGEDKCAYGSRRVPLGFALMFGAGALSGLLGIGSGAVKVLAMDRAMGLPFKVSTTTSNFMIGVTAAASAGVYLGRGYIDPGLAMPVMLGVLGGALLGSRLLISAPVAVLRRVFRGVLFALAIEMIYNGATGRL